MNWFLIFIGLVWFYIRPIYIYLFIHFIYIIPYKFIQLLVQYKLKSHPKYHLRYNRKSYKLIDIQLQDKTKIFYIVVWYILFVDSHINNLFIFLRKYYNLMELNEIEITFSYVNLIKTNNEQITTKIIYNENSNPIIYDLLK
jgi:hypothetical protein